MILLTMKWAWLPLLIAVCQGASQEKPIKQGTYDYIIVGAGSGGSVLSAKLAKGGKSVLLLEAGPDDDWTGKDVSGNVTVDPYDPEDYDDIQYTPEIDDAVMSEPVWELPRHHDPRLSMLVPGNLTGPLDRYKEFLPRAKIVGGCSMHNFMFYYRGSPEIYNSWGSKKWSWDVLFPKFKAIETDLEPKVDPAYHGTSGENKVSTREAWITEAGKEFMKCATKAGYPYNNDLNGASLVGIGPAPTSTYKSRRWSASRAFLTPEVRKLPNFHLVTNALVAQVLFEGGTGRRVVGVRYYDKDGQQVIASVVNDVILSAGAYRTPQLLMLSGVGPADVLQTFKIPEVAVVNGVGRNLQDHLMVPVLASAPPGKLASNSSYAPYGGYFFSDWCKERNCTAPDLEWMCGHANKIYDQPFPAFMDCLVDLVGSIKSRTGFLTLKSMDPNEYPAIYPNYLGAQEDIDRLAWAVKETCRIYSHNPEWFKPPPSTLGPPICWNNSTMDDFRAHVKESATTVYHPVGTCKMGSRDDPDAVVDDSLRVYGVDGLRVADTSIMPVIPNVNTDAPARMVGYHLADMILEETKQQLPDYATIV